MLDIQLLRKDLPAVVAGLARRGVAFDEAALPRARGRAQGPADAHRGAAGEAQRALEAGRACSRAKGEDASAVLAEVGRPRRRGEGERDGARGAAGAAERLPAHDPQHPARPRCPRAGRATTTSRCAAGARPRAFDFPVKDHVDVGAGLGMLDFDTAAKLAGRALLGAQGRRGAPAPRARAVHARRPHARARLHRGLRAVHGDRRVRRRRLQPRQVQGRPLQARGARPLPHPHRRVSRSPTSCATRSSRRRTCRSGSSATAPASARRRAATARTRAA